MVHQKKYDIQENVRGVVNLLTYCAIYLIYFLPQGLMLEKDTIKYIFYVDDSAIFPEFSILPRHFKKNYQLPKLPFNKCTSVRRTP